MQTTVRFDGGLQRFEGMAVNTSSNNHNFCFIRCYRQRIRVTNHC